MMTSPITQYQSTLSNAYRAYHPQHSNVNSNLKSATAIAKPKKSVRFVEGHTTIPICTPPSSPSPFSPPPASPESPTTSTTGGESKSKSSNKTENQNQSNTSSTTSNGPKSAKRRKTRATNRTRLQVENENAPLPAGLTPRPGAITTTTTTTATESAETHPHPDKLLGRYVLQRGAKRAVWRKAVRFRGSGRVRVLDDPVEHGRELVTMPGWDDGERGDEDDGNGDGNGDEGVTLASVARGETGFTVKAAAIKGRRGRGRGKGKKRVKKGVVVREIGGEAGEGVVEAVGLVEAGGSESESCDEGDGLYDFSLEEAEGWVPVMVAEDEAGDDWVSLTGSWVLMGGAAEAKGDNKV